MRIIWSILTILMVSLSTMCYAKSYSAFSYGKTMEKQAHGGKHKTVTDLSFMTYKQIDIIKTDIGYGILNTFEGHDNENVCVGPKLALLWRIKKYTLSAECAIPYDIRCNDYG